MIQTRRFVTTLISCSFLVAGASASAHGKPHPKLLREPWDQIARGSNSTTLLINVAQSTANRQSDCFIRYTTRVTKETSHTIRIELLRRPRRPSSFSCPANAVRGPFFVPVRLERPYQGQRLVDSVTGRVHELTPRSDLF